MLLFEISFQLKNCNVERGCEGLGNYVLRAGAMPGTAPNQPENRERGKATDWIVALFIVTLT